MIIGLYWIITYSPVNVDLSKPTPTITTTPPPTTTSERAMAALAVVQAEVVQAGVEAAARAVNDSDY